MNPSISVGKVDDKPRPLFMITTFGMTGLLFEPRIADVATVQVASLAV